MKKILSHDPVTGVTEIAHMPDADTFVVETQQDVSHIIEQNKAMYAQTDEKARWANGHTLLKYLSRCFRNSTRRESVVDSTLSIKRQ